MKLEDRIKALLEGATDAKSEEELIESSQLDEKETITTKAGTTIVDDEDEKSDSEKTDYATDKGPDDQNDVSAEGEPDEKEDDSEDEKSDDESEDAADKKAVKEDFTQDEYNGQHEQPGLKKKENMEKLKQDVSADKQDDAGKNAKLKVGAGRKDGEGVKGEKTAVAEPNAKNNVDTQSAETKPAKITVGEHVEAMFAGQELSEEFVTKATTIFEAAVNQMVEQRIEEEVAALQEEFQIKLDEAVSEVQGELVEQVDGFLNAVVEQWIEDNAVALESGIKVEMVSGFINGLKSLFKEHHIEVPEDKLNVVEEQAARIAELEEALVTLDEAHDAAEAEVVALTRKLVVEAVGSDLTLAQREKFAGLVEGIEFVSEDEFKTKVETIKESYFPAKTKVETEITESDVAVEADKDVSDIMQKYAQVLSGPLKFVK